MAQFARPNADDTDANWVKSTGGNTDLYTMIDEAVADDSDYIESGSAPSDDECIVDISTITDPAVSTGHIVRYRYKKDIAAGASINLTVGLYQDTTKIAEQSHTGISSNWTAGSFTLSEAETDNITDYSDLKLRFKANQP